MLVISGLINGVGNRIQLNEFGNFLTFALKGASDEGVTKLACGIVSDLTAAFGEKFAEHIDVLVPLLFEIMKSQEFDRDSKLQAIIAVGDFCMNCSTCFSQRYLAQSLSILDNAAQKSILVVEGEDEDIVDYKRKLRETLVDCYTSIVHGISQNNAPDILSQNLDSLFTFLQRCCSPELRPTEKILKDILGLVGDMADCLGRRIANHVQTPFVSELVNHFI